jgi:hypothetical protein
VRPGLATDPEEDRISEFSRVRAAFGGVVVDKATRRLFDGPPERDEIPRQKRVRAVPVEVVVDKATRRWLDGPPEW